MADFWTEFVHGLSRGAETARKRQQDEEELKVRKKLADSLITLRDMEMKKEAATLKEKEQRGSDLGNLREAMGASLPSDQAYQSADVEAPTAAGRASFEQAKQSGLRSALVGLAPPSQLAGIAGVETPMDPMVKAYIARAMGGLTPEQGAQPEGVAQAPALPPMDIGITAPPGKQPTVRLNPQRQPLGAESRIFADYQREQQALGKTPAEIRTGWQAILSGNAAARTSGGEKGKLDVQQTPGYQQTRRQTAESTRLGSEAGEARAALADLTQSSAILDELDALTNTFITAPDDVSANVQGAKLYAQSLYAKGSPPGVYEARKKNLAEALARNIGGVKGTATEGDIERMVAGMPGFRDTAQSRTYKITAIRTIIDIAVDNKKRLISGEDIDLTAARRQFKKLVDDFSTGKLKPGTSATAVQSGEAPQSSGGIPEGATQTKLGRPWIRRGGQWVEEQAQ